MHLYKRDESGEFKPLLVYDGRNSELFGLLANSGNPFVYPSVNNGSLVPLRGLPDDLSEYVKERYGDGEGYFNQTWYDYSELDTYTNILVDMNKILKRKDKEINELEKKVKELKRDEDDWECVEYLDDEDDYNAIDALQCFMGCINKVLDAYWIWNPKPGEVRIVMWFDW